MFPEEVTLDYVEIQSIPPLPLFTLLATDKESHIQPSPTNLEDQTIDTVRFFSYLSFIHYLYSFFIEINNSTNKGIIFLKLLLLLKVDKS